MPEVVRLPLRMNCRGIDIVSPVDRMPDGYFPYLFNARVVLEGRIDSRPGYTVTYGTPTTIKLLHSIRRLNDVDHAFNSDGYTYIIGNGTTLMKGALNGTTPTQIDTGYSGNPLSLLTFRPENSPVSWMYVYDANKQVKVRPDGEIRPIGVAPPKPPTAEYTSPATIDIATGEDSSGWVGYDGSGSLAVSQVDRTNSSASTVGSILYNSGINGWACINPTTVSSFFWAGERMKVFLNSGGGNEEAVVVREIHPAINATTIQEIAYDNGTTGLCTVVLTGSPANLQRNSLLQFGSENVRVLSVTYSVDGNTYSLRCSTTNPHVAGDPVTGLISWYVYTALTHSAGESITSLALTCASPASGTEGGMYKLTTINASEANGRPIDIANDYLHISVYFQNPQNVTELLIQIDVDAGTTTGGLAGNAFTRNYYTWTVTKEQLNQFGPGGGQGNAWTELVLPLSEGVRSGSDLTRTLATITALQVYVKLESSSATAFGFDCWYLFGTYGPVIQPNAPLGYFYETRNRDTTTGAASIPGVPTRYSLFPLREGIVVQADTALPVGTDAVDIYRQGGTLSEFVYVGTAVVSGGVPQPFLDSQSDDLVADNPSPDLTLLQPWPIQQLAWNGTVNVIGTRVLWETGDQFNVNLLSGSIITINGVAYQTYGQPLSPTELDIAVDAGVQGSVAYEISSPTLAAQPLPFAFGPLEGPYSPVIFGLGDPNNPGFLYYTLPSNADGAPDTNTLEVSTPSNPLIGGGVFAGLVYVTTQDLLYRVRYSFNNTGNIQQFQYESIPAASGQWNRYACCTGPDGWYYVGRDGIYRANQEGAKNITDEQLYPLFPHDGQPASVEHDLHPVDMTAPMRLSAGDYDVYFDYVDTAGNSVALRFQIAEQRWFPHFYADSLTVHYLVERSVNSPSDQQILMLSKSAGFVYKSGGNDDNGAPIITIVHTPSSDGGDQRSQKLYIDSISDLESAGSVDVAFGYNNNVTFSAVQTITTGAARNQYISNIGSLNDPLTGLKLYRNISAKYAWTGGPSGPKLYAFEPSGYVQPYLSKSRVTQYFKPGNVQGWLHQRRCYAALISTADSQLVIKCQDGRSYGPFTIPDTTGLLRIWPIMLDHGIKDLSFAFEWSCDQDGVLFTDQFTIEMKEWTQSEYALVPIFNA